mgnify:CR=1 FL=1
MGIGIKREKMQKGWKYFDVMHKDRRVARVYEDGRCTINYPSFMPYNLYLESSDDFDCRVNNLNNFYNDFLYNCFLYSQNKFTNKKY